VRGTSELSAAVLSPDERFLAASYQNGLVQLCDLRSGELRHAWRGERTVVQCTVSPNGKLLAGYDTNAKIRLWDIASGDEFPSLSGYDLLGECVFSPDDDLLACAGQIFHEVQVWSIARNELRFAVPRDKGGRCCRFSSDGQLLAITGLDRVVRLWDVVAGEEHGALEGHKARTNACAFSHEGSLLATTGVSGPVRLWDLAGKSEPIVLPGHKGPVRDVVFSGDDTLLATAGAEGTVRLWDVAGRKKRGEVRGLASSIAKCAFSVDGRTVATHHERSWKRLSEQIRRMPQSLERAVRHDYVRQPSPLEGLDRDGIEVELGRVDPAGGRKRVTTLVRANRVQQQTQLA
jgi:WD40 repeat protein